MVALNAMRLSWLQKVLVSRKVLITLSRVVKQATVQLIFIVVVLRDWKINQFDIYIVFLNKTLNKEVYMQQPPGFVDSNHTSYMWRLHKSLYGLKQAPRTWYTQFNDYLFSIGFHASKADTSLFILFVDGDIFYLLVYVDDIG